MDDLKLLLIDRLKSKGLDPSRIPGFLKALTSLISSEPGLEPAQMHQRLQSLGWNEAAIDYHSLQIAIAWFEAETKNQERQHQSDRLVVWSGVVRYPVNPFDYRMLEEKLLEFSHKFRLPDDLTIIELIYRGPTRARLVLL